MHRRTGEAARARFSAPASFDVSDAIMAAIAASATPGVVEARGDEGASRPAPAESGTQPIRRSALRRR